MKIRQGFVSNSSSSSFIVGFKKKPKDVEELKKILFGDRQEYHNPYGDEHWSTDEVAQIVFNDMEKQLSKKKALDWIGVNRSLEEIKKLEKEDPYDMLDSYTSSLASTLVFLSGLRPDPFAEKLLDGVPAKELGVRINDTVDAFFANKNHKYVYGFTYSDNAGALGSSMEHGKLFDKVGHMIINEH